MAKTLTIALAGNPNSGKTTVFNNLTGARQHVGNYPGVTVEKKEGTLRFKDYDINVVDLPGTYSLTAYSPDEAAARNFIMEEKPDVVVDVIDASNLERNLYLTTQFMELGVPLILVFNMHDLALRHGIHIDKDRLSELLGCPIVLAVAVKKTGMAELLEEVVKMAETMPAQKRAFINYSKEIQEELDRLEQLIAQDPALAGKYPARWLGIKLLENDREVVKQVENSPYVGAILTQTGNSMRRLQTVFDDTPEAVIADRRYGFISGACSEAVRKTSEIRHTISDRIDKVLINRALGLPIFLGLIWLVFQFTFKLSEPLMGWIEAGQEWLGNLAGGILPAGGAMQSLVVDGIIGGVGSVLIFIPIIFLLFLALAALEDSGYMARAAFIMDRIMHKIGLHGRSFIPMLLGFGCNVPAIMAARTIEDRKDRLTTILVNPFMTCGARLPVYTLFIGAFFSEKAGGNVLFSLYLLGIAVAVVMAKLFRKFLLKGEAAPFVMELPPYRMPTVQGLLLHTWERGALYVKKAGTIIFTGCVLVWFLTNFPWQPQYARDYDTLIEQAQGNEEQTGKLENEKAREKMEKSYAGRLGKAIAPVFRPLGFDDWKVSVGLIGGFIAKEIVVGTLGTLHSVGEADEESESLRQSLQNETKADGSKLFTPLAAYALMVFVLLYIPCVAVIAVIKRETNSWRWPIFAVCYTTAVAWIAAFIIYQGGTLLGLGT